MRWAGVGLVDIQQISIASLILALGLLVDDPVVAGDAIKRSLGEGWPRVVAAWPGPTKLATAILFVTITNIVAHLPFLTLPGDVGNFIFSLPVVLTCSPVASRLVSMTFVPLVSEEKKTPIDSVTMFVGGGGPRFWFSVNPEIQQLNYAQLIVQTRDKRDTRALIAPMQEALSKAIAGARIDVRELENGKPVGIPASIRISGESLRELRLQAERVKAVLRKVPIAERVRDD